MLFKATLLLIAVSAVHGACKANPTAIELIVLNAHNKYRKLHENTPMLCYGQSDDTVTYTAQDWAETQVKARKMKHSGGMYGENLYWTSRANHKNLDAYELAVKLWYDENRDWDFKKSQGPIMKTGHFTQVVWRDTQEVSCGFAQSKLSGTFVTCQYTKRGNSKGGYAANVAPIIIDEPSSAAVSIYVSGSGMVLLKVIMVYCLCYFLRPAP